MDFIKCLIHINIVRGDLNVALLINSHQSLTPGQCSDQVNLSAVRSAMAAIWAIHQINVNQNASQLKLGLYLYDTCSDESISERQTVRILSHLDDIQSKTCLKDRESPLIGAISSGKLYRSTLNLFTSFQVPIITTQEQDPMEIPGTTLFTVASSLKYLSKAVMGLLNKLNWSQATLVVSDEVPLYYTKVLEDIATKVRFNVQNSPIESTVDYPNEANKRDSTNKANVKNTILFLSSEETLKLFSSLKTVVPPDSEDFDWIVVTSQDISAQIAHLYSSKESSGCHTKPLYLILPQHESTPELHDFLSAELSSMGDSIDPLFRELLESATFTPSSSSSPNDSSSSTFSSSHYLFSSMIKSVWSYGLALRSYERKYCTLKGPSYDCSPSQGVSLVNLIQSELMSINGTINDSGFASLNGFKLHYDDEHYLVSNRYGLKAITSNCQIMDMGYFEDGVLFNREARQSGGSSKSTGDQFKSVSRDEEFFESESPNSNSIPASLVVDDKEVSSNNLSDSPSSQLPSYGRPFIKPLPSDYVLRLKPMSSGIDTRNEMKSATEKTIGNQHRPIESGTSSPGVNSKQMIERNSIVRTNRLSLANDEIVRKRYSSFYSWLGHSWTVTIISLNVIGILIALYTFTYILMKSCEGAFKKSNQDLATFHILSIIIVYFGAILYVFPPTILMCSLRTSIHNISCTMLFGSLLQRGMYLRAQKWIGLGGKISKLNQCLTLLFIIGIQLALEMQRWAYESPWSNDALYRLPKECSPNSKDYILSQSYLILISTLLIMVSWSARHQPFAFKDGKHIFITSTIIFPVYMFSVILVDNLTESPETGSSNLSLTDQQANPRLTSNRLNLENYAIYRDIITSLAMILMASASLFGIFGPIIYTIQKYGILPPKNGSYAESLSTAFTLFRGLEGSGGGGQRENSLLDRLSNVDSSSNTTEGSIGRSKNKLTKRSDIFPYIIGPTANFKFGLKPGIRDRTTCPFNHCHNHLNCNFGECSHIEKGLIKNPLYEDQGFRSAYP
ncbi:uncharacterized protein LOC107366253 isoform X2 [Tetranychus urticae]|uniref:uncharacterized protein LOC107366253 isoform X2 n=1 Tax=Tetranychus urticae TaxID=32264 RepID=UPI000D64C469|nr:uncharacterized protein LOC107366253 isoform X2 [Tetranychus urticae]